MPLPTSLPADALLDSARVLARAARTGQTRPLLRGKYFALVCDDADSGDARALCRAAAELGARVACIAPGTIVQPGGDTTDLGRMLSLLYDAIECQGVPAERVEALRRSARIPVHDGLVRLADGHAPLDAEGIDDGRHYLLQAALLADVV